MGPVLRRRYPGCLGLFSAVLCLRRNPLGRIAYGGDVIGQQRSRTQQSLKAGQTEGILIDEGSAVTSENKSFQVDFFRPEDAEGITQLFRAVYGEAYPIKTFTIQKP